jgi:two-component system, chemotaxis family, CheB/CheR fusion protein
MDRMHTSPAVDHCPLPTTDPARGDPLPLAPLHDAEALAAAREMQQRLQALEQELHHTRETLQAGIAELEADNAALRSTNAALHRVNTEQQSQIQELTTLHHDVDHVLRSIDLGAVFLDRNLCICRFTPAATTFLSLMEHDLGRPLAEVAHTLVQTDLCGDVQEVLRTGVRIEKEVQRRDGTWLLLRLLPFLIANNLCQGVVLTCIDITHLKQTEETARRSQAQLQQILEATPDFVVIADTRERVLYLNAAGRRMLGVAAQGPLQLKVADFVPTQVLRAIREEGAPMAREHGTWTGEAVVIGGDGREIPVSLVIIAHPSPRGEVEAFSTIMRDITEQQRVQEMLRRRADEMETFAYSASHDLQAPLRTFEGYARWLLEDYGHALDAEGRQLCEEIMADAVHMKTLLDGLLEYSRIGRLNPQAVVVDTKSVLEWVLHDLQLEIVDKGATLHLPAFLPTVIYPEGRLTQVFSNLISNALKFTVERPPEITIGCEDHPGYYRFSVRDNGIGIAPEHHERIFEIFKRLHTRDAYPGTGVGLTIVKRIVETHGGQIGVESILGEGATFWVTIPKTKLPLCTNCP